VLHTAHYWAREKPPIDPATREYWDSGANENITLISGVVDVWKGAMTGLYNVPAPSSGQRPNYLTDPSLRGTVVQTSSTGSKSLANTALSTVIASGTRPYTISAFRLHTALPGSSLYGLLGFGILATSDPLYLDYQSFGGSELRPQLAGVNVQATATHDLLVHVVECWLDGVNANVRDNGTLFQAANAAGISGTLTAIGIGRAASTNTHFANCNHAFHMICVSKPSDAYITRLKLWLHYNKGVPIPTPQVPPLPSTAVAAWHSEINCTAAAWVDYIGAKSLTGVNTPTVATDGSFFNGRVVGKTAKATTAYWHNGALGTVLASGTRPWMFVVGRRTGVANSVNLAGFGQASGVGWLQYLYKSDFEYAGFNASIQAFGGTPDQAVHTWASWLDGTNANLSYDGVTYSVASAATLGGNAVAFSIGGGVNTAFCSDSNVAFFLVCSAKPTAAEELALNQWARSYWGTP
jgi:hypothetical protein